MYATININTIIYRGGGEAPQFYISNTFKRILTKKWRLNHWLSGRYKCLFFAQILFFVNFVLP